MPELMRFGQIDPVTDEQENYSPYQYGWNNPVLRSDPNGDCPICYIFLAGLLLASEPALAPSGGKNAKQEMAAYRQAYNDMGSDVISSVMPVGKSKTVGQALYATAKKEAKEEIKEQAQKAAEKASAKTPPNPNGKKGGKAHQEMNEKEAERMQKEGKQVIQEDLIQTPDGKKSKRFVDQTGIDPQTGKKERVQVGKQNKNGTPVKRERDAMDDIEKATGERPKFVPYN